MRGAQYKDSYSIANKIGDMLAELHFQQNYGPTILDLKQKEEQKIIHKNHANK